jgi:hypothetical protein
MLCTVSSRIDTRLKFVTSKIKKNVLKNESRDTTVGIENVAFWVMTLCVC